MRRILFVILLCLSGSIGFIASSYALGLNRVQLAFFGGDTQEREAYNYPYNNGYQQYSYNQRQHARRYGGGGFPHSRPATGRRVFIFNPNILTWAVYDSDGELVRTGHGVGGRSYCPDVGRHCKTPIGTFRIYAKAGPGFRSSKFPVPYGGAPMPWAMFFHSGFAVHGSYEVPGYNASHGCIRVYPEDARWLNTSFLSYGSTVIVYPY